MRLTICRLKIPSKTLHPHTPGWEEMSRRDDSDVATSVDYGVASFLKYLSMLSINGHHKKWRALEDYCLLSKVKRIEVAR